MNASAIASLCLLTAFGWVGASCSSSSSSASYPTAHAGVAHKLEHGTVLETRDVVIDGQATHMGSVVGAGLGTAAGAIAVPVETRTSITPNGSGGANIHTKSNSHENHAAMAVGAVVGTVVGRHVEKKLSTKKAQELIIQLDSGERVVIIQQNRGTPFHAEERVQVYTTGYGNSRVFHGDEDPYVDPDTNAYLFDEEDYLAEEDGEEPVLW